MCTAVLGVSEQTWTSLKCLKDTCGVRLNSDFVFDRWVEVNLWRSNQVWPGCLLHRVWHCFHGPALLPVQETRLWTLWITHTTCGDQNFKLNLSLPWSSLGWNTNCCLAKHWLPDALRTASSHLHMGHWCLLKLHTQLSGSCPSNTWLFFHQSQGRERPEWCLSA